MKVLYLKNVVSFNVLEDFLDAHNFQNNPYPYRVHLASSPLADTPLPSTSDVIYLRPLCIKGVTLLLCNI